MCPKNLFNKEVAFAAPTTECPNIINLLNNLEGGSTAPSSIANAINSLNTNINSFNSNNGSADNPTLLGNAEDSAVLARDRLSTYQINLRNYAINDCGIDDFERRKSFLSRQARNYNTVLETTGSRRSLFPAEFNPTDIEYTASQTNSNLAECQSTLDEFDREMDRTEQSISTARSQLPLGGIDGLNPAEQTQLQGTVGLVSTQILRANIKKNEAINLNCNEGETAERFNQQIQRLQNVLNNLNQLETDVRNAQTSLATSGATLGDEAIASLEEYFGCDKCNNTGVPKLLETIFKPFCCLLWSLLDTMQNFVIQLSEAIGTLLVDL